MKINKDVRSTVKPLEMDVTSSKNYVYIRSNIREEKDGDIVEYVYDEQILTKDEYNNKKLEEISNKVNNVINTTDLSLEEAKNYMVSKMGSICKQVIIDGVDIQLSNGNIEHFSMTTEDQSNISTQVQFIMAFDLEEAAYHADKEDCRFYSAEDFLRISLVTNKHKLEQTTYCNILNNYIRSLNTKEEVLACIYGMELPSDKMEYIKNTVYRQINGLIKAIVKKYGSSVVNGLM